MNTSATIQPQRASRARNEIAGRVGDSLERLTEATCRLSALNDRVFGRQPESAGNCSEGSSRETEPSLVGQIDELEAIASRLTDEIQRAAAIA